MTKPWKKIDALLNELITMQRKKLLAIGRDVVPRLTEDDILQPNDFPELELNPLFRYEEGVLAGILSAQMALYALQKEMEHD